MCLSKSVAEPRKAQVIVHGRVDLAIGPIPDVTKKLKYRNYWHSFLKPHLMSGGTKTVCPGGADTKVGGFLTMGRPWAKLNQNNARIWQVHMFTSASLCTDCTFLLYSSLE